MTSVLPFGIQDWLGSLPAAFQEPIPSCLVGVAVGWFHLNLDEWNYLLTATKPVSGKPGIQTQMEKETTQEDLMLWDGVGTEEEEWCWKGREGKGLARHPFQVSLGLPLSCGHKQKQYWYFRKCSRIGTFKRKVVCLKRLPRAHCFIPGLWQWPNNTFGSVSKTRSMFL